MIAGYGKDHVNYGKQNCDIFSNKKPVKATSSQFSRWPPKAPAFFYTVSHAIKDYPPRLAIGS